MSDRSSSTNPTAGKTGPDDSIDLPRRAVLRATVGAGAVVLGAGTAGADGRGGQAVVHDEDYRPDGSFVITEVSDCEPRHSNPDGSCWDDPLLFQCDGNGGRVPPGKGGKIPFPYWYIQYYDEEGNLEDEKRQLYTRDNEVETGITYRWPGKAKECPDGLIQTGFAAEPGNGNRP